MLRSFWSNSKLNCWMGRGPVAALCLVAACMVALPRAEAVDFTMTVGSNLSPSAVAPAGNSSAQISIVTGSGFAGPISLACTVTPSIPASAVTDMPICTVSPSSMSASGQSTATITTQELTTTILYTITITATDASGTATSPALDLTVLSVAPQFTITVQSAVAPSSVPAGAGAEGVLLVSPVNGYQTPNTNGVTGPNQGITFYCATITPLVTLPPFCSFSYPQGYTTLPVTQGQASAATSTITINTLGSTTQNQNCANPLSRHFYALWIGLPMLSLVGMGAGFGKRSKKAWLVCGLVVVAAGFLLTPSCTNTNNIVCTPNGVTPANSYTFTIVGVDSAGVASSNTVSGSSSPTVSLTVTAPVP